MQASYGSQTTTQPAREPRRVVLLQAKLFTDAGNCDATICNVSLNGLMAKCESPPRRGAYVELRYAEGSIVGRVMWSQGSRFGLRSRDKIEIARLRGKDEGGAQRGSFGKVVAPLRQPLSAAEIEERSRQTSRLFEWVMIAIAAAGAAGMGAGLIYSAIATPMEKAQAALSGNP
ncbi:MAG: PilZ domain-containing protein [Novosphingobium sp.]|nr:PilZ domain-containing protein [Novosphingobium sp.]